MTDSLTSEERCAQNTDRELWRLNPDSYYSPSLHVTAGNNIGMNVGGHVVVMPIEIWHEIGLRYLKSIERITAP